MKIPNQAQPITRGISTVKIIGAKGIVQNGNPIFNLNEHCKKICGGKKGVARMRCIAACVGVEAIKTII
ncbi:MULTISPECIES: hypothetical protein [unclassified Microcoleus]|uniref:hypothetical protein n=1 Tax=unclassified Microcoleus TaxID=2642155 RepID=UPI002FD21E26